MCILLYIKLIWCSGFPEIYAQLEEGVGSVCHDDFSICALYDNCNCFGVVVLHRYTVDLRRGEVNLPWVYVHSTIYETYLV